MKIELRYKRCALCVLGLLIGPAFIWLGWISVRDEVRLRKEGVNGSAVVTDWRTMRARHGSKLYEVQYNFAAKGWAGRFYRRDPVPLGRNELWSPISEASWTKSRRTQAIEVVYLNADPWVNRPVDTGGGPLTDSLTALLSGIGAVVASVSVLGTAAFQHSRRHRLMAGRTNRDFVLFRAEARRALVSLESFFEGNDDPGSFGSNLPHPVSPHDFYLLLKNLHDRDDVHDILIERAEMETGGWPFSDTIWFITSADPATVRSWFPEDLAPDAILDGFTPHVAACDVPAGLRAIGAWYD